MNRRVLVTGAGGLIGRAIAPLLPAGWDLVRTDLRAGDGIRALDVTDVDACRAAFTGVDAVVHLAAVPDPEASWDQLLPPNVVGAHQVARAAGDCGVRRLVLASSLQAVSALPAGTQIRLVQGSMLGDPGEDRCQSCDAGVGIPRRRRPLVRWSSRGRAVACCPSSSGRSPG
jgi:NAD(P)-dependent dehydrogenase (short-subunit alcohol dehydrogenase family)